MSWPRGAPLWSSATVYKHFPTKAALFGGIIKRLWANDAEAPRAATLDILGIPLAARQFLA